MQIAKTLVLLIIFIFCMTCIVIQYEQITKIISMRLVERIVTKQPHLLFILADDYGWNDIGKDFEVSLI